MKLFISADMEGISGIVNWDQVTPGHAEHSRFRKIMTSDVNAAIKGAKAGGVTNIQVTDGHWTMNNILVEDLDSEACLHSGSDGILANVQGVQEGVDAVFLIGFHARSGTPNVVLDHTWSSRVTNLSLNGQPIGEIGLAAAVCGHYNVPVIMISGDQAACDEAAMIIPQIEAAIVKRGSGRMSAHCLPLITSQNLIRDTAAKAVSHFLTGKSPSPLIVPPPIKMSLEFTTSDLADNACILPMLKRRGGRIVEFEMEDMVSAFALFRASVYLATR